MVVSLPPWSLRSVPVSTVQCLGRADLSNCSHLLSRLQPSGHRASKHVQFLNAPLHKHRQLFAKIVFSIIGKYLKEQK